MKTKIIFHFICLLFGLTGFAKEYKISSAAELSALQLAAGDKVILKNGEWKDQRLVFKGRGTEKNPIILSGEKGGAVPVKLTGNSSIRIEGEWLVVEGLFFTNGYSLKEDVILFTPSSKNCRVTNSGIFEYNPPDKKTDYKWVSMWGHNNRFDHNWLEGKKHQGTTLVVWLDSVPNHHRIHHNYFGSRPELGVNGGETIRIGNSTWSFSDSYTIVEKNIFDHCDGELEIISNKSGHNTVRDNLFYESAGTMTFRHGNHSEVYRNFFIGNHLPKTGGIRVIGEDHKVYDNYLHGLTGTGVSAALSLMSGLPDPELTSHWQVKNASITNNIIIDCKEPFNIGAGKNPQRWLKAENTVFAGNTIISKEKVLHWSDDSVVIRFTGNKVWPSSQVEKLPDGFSVEDVRLTKKYGLYHPSADKPFWKKEKIGPAWMKLIKEFKIKG